MSTTTRDFHIGTILTITSGKLISPIGTVYEICDWMTGESTMTHQLPRVSREIEGTLRGQHPDLAAEAVIEWRIRFSRFHIEAHREGLARSLEILIRDKQAEALEEAARGMDDFDDYAALAPWTMADRFAAVANSGAWSDWLRARAAEYRDGGNTEPKGGQ
ncbi:DUF7736 domain-containing protein [Leifsonia poae]|uniref:DUF7736 domain-containing protein n=1 Tax=Leifsonia poae TaxID=110933 RepID=UPI001CBC1F19|nr:hypothetical protein [Leifsonia poae]